MDINKFGKTSYLYLTAELKDNKTLLTDIKFSAPYKIMQPFIKDNKTKVILLSASAGIMEGDRQEFHFEVKNGANLEFNSQSYDKIHKMYIGCAKRKVYVHVEKNANFCFNPQPTIPFKDSAFENTMKIYLDDETASFQMSEIFSCGRYMRNECFAYRHYYNYVEIYRGDKLIYRDNTKYIPKLFSMSSLGMYEGYTHLANIFISKSNNTNIFLEEVNKLLNECDAVDGGITELINGDFSIRIFAFRAQILEDLTKKILSLC